MSLESWKEEFYPVPANEVSEADAVKHSRRKWIGLRPENLIHHKVWMHDSKLTGKDGTLEINSESCALCHHYLDPTCKECPLRKLLGRPCDIVGKPYEVFFRRYDPELMITALEQIGDTK